MSSVNFVILAAGRGVRMNSDRPKPLKKISGKMMIERVCSSAGELEPDTVVAVVSDRRVENEALRLGCVTAWQDPPLGTADALKKALPECPDTGEVIVTCADIPLVTGADFKKLLESHRKNGNYITVLTSSTSEPAGYGRVVEENGRIIKIVEEKEATAEEKKIRKINTGIYCMNILGVEKYIKRIRRSPVKGEYYLTDLVEEAVKDGRKAAGVECEYGRVLGVNNPKELKRAEEILESRGSNE